MVSEEENDIQKQQQEAIQIHKEVIEEHKKQLVLLQQTTDEEGVGCLKMVNDLTIKHATCISIETIVACRHLTKLELYNVESARSLSFLQALPALECLTLAHLECSSLSLTGCLLPLLKRLKLWNLPWLTDLTILDRFPVLESAELHNCNNVWDFGALRTMKNVEIVDCQHFDGMVSTCDDKLESLWISQGLKNVSFEQLPTSIRHLRLTHCAGRLTSLVHIQTLSMFGCRHLEMDDFFSNPAPLEKMQIELFDIFWPQEKVSIPSSWTRRIGCLELDCYFWEEEDVQNELHLFQIPLAEKIILNITDAGGDVLKQFMLNATRTGWIRL